MDLVSDLTLVLIAALAGGFLAHRAQQPLIVGYLLAGVVVGPLTGGLTVRNPGDIEALAEIGVVLLLFSLGLEVSFRELAPVRTVAIAGALIQVALTMALGFGLGSAFGWAATPALWFGACIALSSTMVALKTVQAQGRLGTLSSSVMLGILIVQDLAVVPLMIVLPALGGTLAVMPVVVLTLRALAVLAGVVVVSIYVVPRLLSAVAWSNSRELFLLATTAVAVGVGFGAWRLGLSPAIGAFVAGLAINESEYAHQALSDVIPLRDLFGMLFFVSAGMLLDPALVWHQAGALAIIVVAVTVVKALILGVVVALFGYRRIVPLATGLTLFQVGEFAFVLARAGESTGALPHEVYSLILNTAIVTMALTPALSGTAPRVYARFRRNPSVEPPLTINMPAHDLSKHVVIAGGGRVGQTAAEALAVLDLPFVVIEYDAHRLEHLRKASLPVIFGDAGREPVLEAASIRRARAVLITVPAFPDFQQILRIVRALAPGLPIVARAGSADAVRTLRELGIDDVASPEFEAAMAMTRQVLTRLDVSPSDILRVLQQLRDRHYQ